MSLLVGMVMMAVASGPVETQVRFTGAGGFTLYGTLTMPTHASGHSMPGVLLLPGSGPTDRNGNQPPQIITDVLKQISASLAERGFATLRFDKRATHLYTPKFPKNRSTWPDFFKWENFVEDAACAYRFLGSQPGVDAKRVAIIGHSEGAEIALQIGSNMEAKPNPPAALVTIGGAGRPMGPILMEQIDRALTRQNAPAPVKKQYMDSLKKTIAQIIENSTYPDDMLPGLSTLFNPTTTMIMHSYCVIDPSVLARHYRGPVLIINGAHDKQVSPERDAPVLKAALEKRKSGTVEMLIVPDASHNLKSTKAGDDDAFSGPVDPLALDTIKQFLTKQLHP